jgi:hypothetical protein
MSTMSKHTHVHLLTLAATFLAVGCADTGVGSGDLTVLVEPEDTIVDGLDPGDSVESIRDGWTVRFDKMVVAIGDVDLHLSTDDAVEAAAHEVFAVDLAGVGGSGAELWELPGLRAGRWEIVWATPAADESTTRAEGVTDEDLARMQAEGFTYLVAATLTKPDGVSCPPTALAQIPADAVPVSTAADGRDCFAAPSLAIDLGAEADTLYGPCEVDGTPGVSIASGGTQTVALTIHGDHLFFNGFPEGSEGGTQRLAQWWADADLDLDGTVTAEELQSISPSDLAELDDRYQLGGSPITPLDDMYDYVRAQLKTQGHFQGEGECPVDGAEDDHDHG